MNNLHSSPSNLDLITSFLGVPGYILTTFLPTFQHFAAKQPKLIKFICVIAALSTFGSSLLERVKRTLLSFLISNFMFSTTIDATDPLYDYVQRWLKERRKILPEQDLQARSKEEIDRNHNYNSGMVPLPPIPGREDQNEKKNSRDVMYDFNGLQIFWHQWRPIFVAPHPSGRTGHPQYLAVRCFGFSSEPLRAVIDEAYSVYRKNDQANSTAVYRPVSRSNGWKCVARRNRRSLETIVMDPDEKSRLLEDIEFYISDQAKEWYAARGIPYRRGYLFHGKPGTGKTSLSMAIAGQFGLDIYIVSLQDPNINDSFLHTFFTNLPKGALILLEDIDSAGLARETATNSLQSYSNRRRHRRGDWPQSTATRVTLSGLLNAIDGADSPEGHLLIMTTNAPEALDEALIRPGRIDYKIGFKATGKAQAESIFLRMYTGDVEDDVDLQSLAERFAALIPEDTFTPAELQGHLMRHKKQPEEALAELNTWMQDIISERDKLAAARLEEEDRLRKKDEKKKLQKKALNAALLPTPETHPGTLVASNNVVTSTSKPSVEADTDSDSSDSGSARYSARGDVHPDEQFNWHNDSQHSTMDGDPANADHSLPFPDDRPPRHNINTLNTTLRHMQRAGRGGRGPYGGRGGYPVGARSPVDETKCTLM